MKALLLLAALVVAGLSSSSAGVPTPMPQPTDIFAEDLPIKSPHKVETRDPVR